MSPIQKESWGMVVGFGVGLVVFVILVPLRGIRGAWPAPCLYALGGFAPLIFRTKRNTDIVASDERSKMIVEKATKAGGIAAFQVTLLVCLIPWGIFQYQGKQVIGIDILPFILFMAMTALWVTRAIVVLVLYGREPKDG